MKLFKKLRRKWAYSLVGLFTAIREEKSLWAYSIIFPILIGIGVWLKLSTSSWAIITISMFLTISIEIINTALEAAVDAMSFQYNIKVKKIKDVASGATLVITLGLIATLLIIFIPAIQGAI